MERNPFLPIASMAQVQSRIIETLGVPYADPFNEEGQIADVNDPLKLGRVKVRTDDQIVSDWIPVSGSNSGTLSARYIGAQVLIGKRRGRSEDMYVIGVVRSDPGVGINGNPLQLPIIDESMAVWNGSTDPGMSCNEGNQGRMYVLSNEMNQDVVVCLRRNSKQVGNKSSWAWKSITNGLWVEKGINPGNETTLAIEQGQKRNPGIPECSEALAGEEHEFAEDRGFRTIKMICQRDENKVWNWRPSSAVPTYFRTTMPNCTEELHGMEAVLDDGNNSELLICQRYQGLMRWVKQGRRVPHKFHPVDKPLSRIEFTSSYNPVPALEEGAVASVPLGADIPLGPFTPLPAPGFVPVPGGNLPRPNLRGLPGPDGKPRPWGWRPNLLVESIPEMNEAVLATVIPAISLTGTDPALRALLETAALVPATAFDGAETLQQAAREALLVRTGIPVETLFQTIRQELDDNGSLTLETGTVLAGLGAAADVLVNGVIAGDTSSALLQIGQDTLRNALLSLEPRAASVMTGLMSGGIAGAIDSAVAIGLDELPPEVSKYVRPVIDIAQGILASAYPATLGNILNSAAGGGLLGAISSTINIAAGSGVVNPALLESIVTGLGSGSFGEIPKLFGSLSNLDAIAKMPEGLGSLPVLATTAMGLIGQADSLTKLFGQGGLGIDGLNSLVGGGFNAAATIFNGVAGLKGVFGGGDGDCPCGPNCRKTAHGEDSDGNNLLEKCGALTANNANSYSPGGLPVPNNTGPVAQAQGLVNTLVGSNLIPSNRADLTKMVEQVDRVKEMAERFNAARFADLPEHLAELAYTFEAVEKSFKTADNNITGVESVERKLIDALYNLLNNFTCKKGGSAIMTSLMNDAKENAQAIRDLYKYVKKLDRVKDGGSAAVRVTTNLANSFANIPGLVKLSRKTCVEAKKIMDGAVKPADKEWRDLTPGKDFTSVLGTYGPAIPAPYPDERTLFDRDRILAISAESKLGETSPQPTTLLESVLAPDQIKALKRTGAVSGELAGSDVLNGGTGAVSGELAGSDVLNGGTGAVSGELAGSDVLNGGTGPGLSASPGSGESSLYDTIVGREGKTDCG
jgi:hypothetical protein